MTFSESHVGYCQEKSRKQTNMLLDFIKDHYLADGCKNFFDLMLMCSD
jgi:hypothetical protein